MTPKSPFSPYLVAVLMLGVLAIAIFGLLDFSNDTAILVMQYGIISTGGTAAVWAAIEIKRRQDAEFRRMDEELDLLFRATREEVIRYLQREEIRWWDVLGVAQTAPVSEIKARYRALAKKYHSDTATDGKGDPEQFRAVTEAYDAARREKSA